MFVFRYRLFLLWYQALGDFAPDHLHAIFATLVPGFPSPVPGEGLPSLGKQMAVSASSGSIFHDNSHGECILDEFLAESNQLSSWVII